MKTTTADIRDLVSRIDKEEILLPEIQRGYVWKPPKVAALIDSLYRRYPSGSLLLWETGEHVELRGIAITGPDGKPMNPPQYLIDGQQRLTSLHRVFNGHENARIVFNVETERFQNESAATKKDPRWIPVHSLLSGDIDTYTLVDELKQSLPDIEPKVLSDRLDRVRKIADYHYFVEILNDLAYEEVADIFVRVNSKGVTLRAVDLALATLSARWRGVVAKLEEESRQWRLSGYDAISVSFLARCLAAMATEVGGFRGFASAPLPSLEEGWRRAQRGIEHLVPLLKNNAKIATSELLPSDIALVPLVAFLGLRPEKPLAADDADAMIYWLFAAFIKGRYSGSTETVLAQDLAAVRSQEPLEALYRNLGLLGERVIVRPDQLAGRGVKSPYFLLSYLVAQNAGARDWWYGVDICTDGKGSFKLEYHHIHPRATLSNLYGRSEINDLANLAFISSRANKKISDRSPARYFPELGDAELVPHFVPTDPELRVPDTYPAFIRERRRLLADAMTSLLNRFRPEHLTSITPFEDPTLGERLTFQAFGSGADDEDAVLRVEANANGHFWAAELPLHEFVSVFKDVQDGNPSGIAIGDAYAVVDAEADPIELQFGPLMASGQLEDWLSVLDREVGDMTPLEDKPSAPMHGSWSGESRAFPVIDSD